MLKQRGVQVVYTLELLRKVTLDTVSTEGVKELRVLLQERVHHLLTAFKRYL